MLREEGVTYLFCPCSLIIHNLTAKLGDDIKSFFYYRVNIVSLQPVDSSGCSESIVTRYRSELWRSNPVRPISWYAVRIHLATARSPLEPEQADAQVIGRFGAIQRQLPSMRWNARACCAASVSQASPDTMSAAATVNLSDSALIVPSTA